MAKIQSPRLRWLHISDLHLKSGDTYEQDVVLGAFVRSVRDEGLLAGRPVDLVFCTGDVAHGGKPEQYRPAKAFFEDLLAALELRQDRLFVVPGNHDLDRDLATLGPQLSDRDATDAFFGNTALVDGVLHMFHGYRGFHRELFGYEPPSGARPFTARQLEVNGLRVGVIGFNDAWTATEDRKKGELVLGERVVRKALEEFGLDDRSKRPDLLIASMHYPLDWLAEFDEDGVASLLLERCDFVLQGHLHKRKPAVVSTPEGEAAVIGVGALYQTRKWRNGAYLVEVFGRGARLHAITFKDEAAGRWILDPTAFDKHSGSFPIPLRGGGEASSKLRVASTEISAAWLDRVRRETRYVELPGVSTRDDKARLVDRVPLDDLFIPLKTTVRERLDVSDARADSPLSADRSISILDHLLEHRFLAIVGEPGSGKSTLLQYVAHQLARAGLGESEGRARLGLAEGGPVATPLFVPLKALARFLPEGTPVASTLADALAGWAAADLRDLSADALRAAFESRRLALLLDGLDEIPDSATRERVSQAVTRAAAAMAGEAGPGFVALTSRPRAYSGEARLRFPFEGCRILDLTREDVERYLTSWTRAIHELPPGSDPRDDPEAKDKLEGLLRAVNANVHVRMQTRTPILLTTLALVFQARGQLPEKRVLLYDEAVDVMLRRFEDPKRRELREHLAGVAAAMMQAATPTELREEESREEVVATIARRLASLDPKTPADDIPREACKQADELLTGQELQAGLLRAPTETTCRFVHRTFQEYLAAWHLADQLEEKAVRALFTRHLEEPSWQETLRLIGGVWAKEGSGKVGRLLKHLVGDPHERTIAERAPGIAAAMGLLTDLEQFGLPDSILDPVRAERDDLLQLLEQEATPLEVRIGLAEALGRAGDTRLGWEDDEHFVLVSAGPYLSGDDMTEVDVPAFRIGRFPVTCSQFLEFVDDGGFDDSRYWLGQPSDRKGLDERASTWRGALNHPVTHVSWFEARAFCRWLNELRSRRDALVWRLPSEAEWEKAARGGLELEPGIANPDAQREFPWVGPWDEAKANSSAGEATGGGTTPVGCYAAGRGPYGAWDQAGNVWEWCVEPAGAAEDEVRVLRGGSWWYGDPLFLRVASRGWFGPRDRDGLVGFRVVAAPPLD